MDKQNKRSLVKGIVSLIIVLALSVVLIVFSDDIYTNLSKIAFLTPPAAPIEPVEPQKPEYEISYGSFKAGVYTATVFGFESDITATVEVSDVAILSVKIDASGESSIGINASRDIKERILSSQTADVDIVSGATYTSDAVIEAVMKALSQASAK